MEGLGWVVKWMKKRRRRKWLRCWLGKKKKFIYETIEGHGTVFIFIEINLRSYET